MSKLGSLSSSNNNGVHSICQAKQGLSVILSPENRRPDGRDLRSRIPAQVVEIREEPSTFSHLIDQQLHAYAVGSKLKRLRLRKGMALVNLGRLSGLSSSMLCKLERGRALPTLPTLLRLSHALGVDLEYFFHDQNRPCVSVVRRTERLRFRNVPNASYSYAFESLNFRAKQRQFNAYWAEFQPFTDKVPSHQHKGAEFLYLLEGELAIRIGAEEHRLQGGDTIYFESNIPHSYRRLGADPCRALIVVSPTEEDDVRIDPSRAEH